MNLSLNDIHKIAKLARIHLEEPEKPVMQAHLNGIFDLIAQMQAVDTSGIAPMAHAQELSLRLREDTPTEANQRDKFQAIAPAVDKGLYLVPKVIE